MPLSPFFAFSMLRFAMPISFFFIFAFRLLLAAFALPPLSSRRLMLTLMSLDYFDCH